MWWCILGSPAWAMTAREAVDGALGRSPALEVADARVKEAEARIAEVRSKLLPSATLSAGIAQQTELVMDLYEMTGNPQLSGLDPVVINENPQFSVLGRASVPLIAPQGWAAVSLTKDAADLSRTEAESERTKITKGVLEAWHAAYAAQTLLAEAQRAKELAARLLEKGQKLSELGAIASQDLIPFRRAVATADAQVAGAAASVEASLGVLHLLTGLEGAPTEPTLPAAAPDLQALLAEMDRSDVRAAQERVQVADERVSVEKKARLPSVGIQGGAVYLNPAPQIGDPVMWRVSLGATIPLVQGGLVNAKANAAGAQAAQASAGARAIREMAEVEVRVAHGALARALTVLQQQETTVQLAQDAVDAAEKKMGEGAGTLVQLQQSQLELIIAVAQRAAARADAAKAADMLTLAVHGTWSG
jgi:outer membrane protein TolC